MLMKIYPMPLAALLMVKIKNKEKRQRTAKKTLVKVLVYLNFPQKCEFLFFNHWLENLVVFLFPKFQNDKLFSLRDTEDKQI